MKKDLVTFKRKNKILFFKKKVGYVLLIVWFFYFIKSWISTFHTISIISKLIKRQVWKYWYIFCNSFLSKDLACLYLCFELWSATGSFLLFKKNPESSAMKMEIKRLIWVSYIMPWHSLFQNFCLDFKSNGKNNSSHLAKWFSPLANVLIFIFGSYAANPLKYNYNA